MFGLATPSRVYLAMAPVDMRKQENGLWSVVWASLGADLADGSLFVFINKARDRVKMLHWDHRRRFAGKKAPPKAHRLGAFNFHLYQNTCGLIQTSLS